MKFLIGSLSNFNVKNLKSLIIPILNVVKSLKVGNHIDFPAIKDKNEKFTLLSLIANGTQEGYDVVFACASEIINHNKEEEEKQKLFNQKVRELQELFKKGSIKSHKEAY